MNTDYYKTLNADLGFEFHLFSMEHPEWLSQNVPLGAIVVFQTDDPGFNAWARQIVSEIDKLKTHPGKSSSSTCEKFSLLILGSFEQRPS